jgi:glucose/arabinose dehydrogenase
MKTAMILAATIVLGCMVCPRSAQATDLTTERLVTGLARPVFVTAPPGDTDRIFIVENRSGTVGRIRIFNLNTNTLNATPFLTVSGIATENEQGLLGLAFDPDYETNGRFFINYVQSGGSGTTRIATGTVSANPDIANATLTNILSLSQSFTNHNGGWIGFGPDGMLYVAFGDGGSGCDPFQAAQTPTNLFGSILRLDVSAGTSYSSPADNPFVGGPERDEIWHFGLRNPFRCSFDRLTGELYIGDVGQGAWEEVDVVPSDSKGGENYGWDCMEGFVSATASCGAPFGCSTSDPELIDPVHAYANTGFGSNCAITGGSVYRGCAIPDLRGTYFFGDSCGAGSVWSFKYQGSASPPVTTWTNQLDPPGSFVDNVVSISEDANGELYICDLAGEVFRVIPDGVVSAPTPSDYDNDGDVDGADADAFNDCMGGPDNSYTSCLCDVFDTDDTDGDVDLRDFADFQRNYTD